MKRPPSRNWYLLRSLPHFQPTIHSEGRDRPPPPYLLVVDSYDLETLAVIELGAKLANDAATAALNDATLDLLEACFVVKQFLNDLDTQAQGDPLREIRKRVHAPLHNVLDKAIRKAQRTVYIHE